MGRAARYVPILSWLPSYDRVWLAPDDAYGVDVVGVLPQGLPSVSVPDVPLTTMATMILPAIGILLVVYSEALGAAREFAQKHGYEIDPDQELNAHGVASVASGLLSGMIVGGGMSGTAVKEGAGARSQVANLVTWGLVVVTVLFLTPLFASLPEAVLAALIINALWHIIASRKLQQVRLVSPTEFWFGALAFAGVIFIDVLPGMLIGLGASLLYFIYRSSRPHLASLGRTPGMAGSTPISIGTLRTSRSPVCSSSAWMPRCTTPMP